MDRLVLLRLFFVLVGGVLFSDVLFLIVGIVLISLVVLVGLVMCMVM